MHGQRLFPDDDCRNPARSAAAIIAGLILDGARRIDTADRESARLMLVQKGIAGESLRELTDADVELLFVNEQEHLEKLDREKLLARDDVYQIGLKYGLTAYA